MLKWPCLKEHIGEWIALIVTVALTVVLLHFGWVMAKQALAGIAVDTTLARTFDMLLLAFVAIWRTHFGAGSTTVNTDQANVSSGGGSPAPANVESMTVEAAPGPAPAEGLRRGLNEP